MLYYNNMHEKKNIFLKFLNENTNFKILLLNTNSLLENALCKMCHIHKIHK